MHGWLPARCLDRLHLRVPLLSGYYGEFNERFHENLGLRHSRYRASAHQPAVDTNILGKSSPGVVVDVVVDVDRTKNRTKRSKDKVYPMAGERIVRIIGRLADDT